MYSLAQYELIKKNNKQYEKVYKENCSPMVFIRSIF